VTEPKRPRRNWIQEERRKTLGDYTCFCLSCGSVWRYFLEGEAELPAACPHCGGETRHRCPECSAPFPSAFAVECEECGAAVREPEVLGVRIRKPGR
jgi:DNA-directed RNA polymerase subunit RPC12/RpoP